MSTEPSDRSTIRQLVARFEMHRDAYVTGRYNETQLRREFIDPMWKALGWDVDNERGYAEAYKDVIHEDAIKVNAEAYSKAPDYCFRIGGVRKFFLEAKKPSVDIRDDPGPAFQLRRYAWSAKLPLSILTDFDELAVYDTRVKPVKTDKAAVARTLILSYSDYVARWDDVASIFGRDAVLRGSFDKYAESSKAKHGTAEVDEAFLQDIERWRDELARNLAVRNPSLTQRALNFAVQATIDRIVFLRISEDRGIEPYGQLLGLTNGPRIYERLFEVFAEADRRYNSGLFHFVREKGRQGDPDNVTPSLKVDDRYLKDVIRSLYYPDSPYEFSVLGADILGQVYEQFLGKVIRLTAGHRAVVEEKPEVKKAGGVYYTPTFVVDYIVRETVGALLKGKKPHDVSGAKTRSTPLRVLDPACGSGSFLLGVYQFLLDWYRDRYVENNPKVHASGKAPILYQATGNEWRLTTSERKRILVTHIFGVDIDPQAVEVTKLSLLLKVLEGENGERLSSQLRFFHERALPDLDNNIKCGNSLIEPEFWDGQQLQMFDEDERYRVNAFDWHANFPAAFSSGGFDVVLGNPPYLSYSGRQSVAISDEERLYFAKKYSTGGWPTAHGLFIERAVRDLSSRVVAYIVPDQVGHLDGYQQVRDAISRNSKLREVRYWGEGVFKGVVTPALTFLTDKRFTGSATLIPATGQAAQLDAREGSQWTATSHGAILAKLKAVGRTLGTMVADPGVHTGNCSKKLVLPLEGASKRLTPVLEGKQIGRYRCGEATKGLDLSYAPLKGEYFTVRPKEKYARAHFVIRQTASFPIVGPREHAVYFRNSLLALYAPPEPFDVRFFVGVLNSRLMRFVYKATVQESQQRAFPQVKVAALRALPIYWPDAGDPKELEAHRCIVALVQQMLDGHREAETLRTAHEREVLRRAINAIDREINGKVYALYGLKPEEISEVEDATPDLDAQSQSQE